MSLISVRVDAKTKKRMSERKDVNWSEVVRDAIKSRIENEEARHLGLAVLLNEKNVIVPDEGFNSVKEIREWRNRRHQS